MGEEILFRLEVANLLSRCGDLSPHSQGVCRIESLDRALEIIAGSQLDAVPQSKWDKARVAALRASRRTLKTKRGFWQGLFLNHELRARKRRVDRLVWQRISHSATTTRLRTTDKSILASHLAELFDVASLVLDADCRSDWPLLIKAADLALDGYLPVDFTGEGQAQSVLVH